MPRNKSTRDYEKFQTIDAVDNAIRQVAQEGARALLQRALESEIDSHLRQYDDLLTDDGTKTVVRNSRTGSDLRVRKPLARSATPCNHSA